MHTKTFPTLANFVYGEEDNTFTNAIGESVVVEIKSTPQETANVLRKVLNNNEKACQLLAEIIHADVQLQNSEDLTNNNDCINTDEFGIWIDPLDGTNEYISQHALQAQDGIYSRGLQCVSVLIGVYHRSSGIPIAGVINQPFNNVSPTGQWQGRYIWAFCYNGINCSSLQPLNTENSLSEKQSIKKCTVVLSSSEADAVIQKLKSNDINVSYASGAGYKLLCVIDGFADAYILSKGSTYKWDTCAPHAILLSMNGSIVAMEKANLDGKSQVMYNQKDQSSAKWNNSKGIIAYRRPEIFQYLQSILFS